jgi:thiol-disulfide isomerase/thioredoxin
MKAILVIPAALFLMGATGFAAADKKPPQGPPPSLDGVTWDERPVSLSGLRGKTVIVLAYATWCDELNNGDAVEMLAQLKDSIQDKPVVVLAINSDKKTGTGPAYLSRLKFTAPNIVTGWDPLMPARFGAKNDLFQYAWINPVGRLVDTGQALAYYGKEAAKQYALSFNLARAKHLGKFAVLDPSLPASVRNLLWPLELNQPIGGAALTAARRKLSASESESLDAGIDRYLDARSSEIAELAKGDVAERLLAYDQASLLVSEFNGRDKVAPAKDLVAELNQDKEFRPELAAKRAYEKARQLAAKSPSKRTRLLMNVSRSFQGTVYGRRAADDMNPPDTVSRPKSIHTWPELTTAQQEAALKEQRAFLGEIRGKVPGRGMQSYETERFLFYSDLPANLINSLYLPYLDQMYAQLCGAFGLDATKNIWKGKATIVAYSSEDDFAKFEHAFYGDVPSDIHAQGLAHCHGDGVVRISCFAGRDPSYFAGLLVHETTHGFEWRYRSGDPVPSWLNEGAAEWCANRVVATDKAILHKVERAVRQMQQTHSLGGDFFTATHISEWQYGAAASITDFLVNYDPAARAAKSSARASRAKPKTLPYRKLIDGIKDGLPWESALQEAYGLSPEQLAQAYGQWIGIPDLRP